jgi:hypothetical protein
MKSLIGKIEQSSGVAERCHELAGQPQETKKYLERVLLWGIDAVCSFSWRCVLLMFGLMAIGSLHAGHELSSEEFTDFISTAYHWVTAGLR